MTTNNVFFLVEVTTRQAEAVFTRHLEDCNRRIEQRKAVSRLRLMQGQEQKSQPGLASYGGRNRKSGNTLRRTVCSRRRRVRQ